MLLGEKQLKKSVTTIEAFAIVVGTIIGSGVFMKPSIVLTNAGSPMMSLMAWVVGGIVTLASALTIAEIATAIPKTGGLYVYLEELFGEVWGFLLGWVQTVITYPASAAALAIVFSTQALFFVPQLTSMQQKLLSIFILLFVIIMNIIATKCGGIIQTIATIGKLVPIVSIIVFGLINGNIGQSASSAVVTLPAGAVSLGFGGAILGTLWAYDGWIGVTNMAGELKRPARQIPLSIIVGVVTVIAAYLLINTAIFSVMTPDAIVATKTPASDAAVILFGTGGASFITAGIMISVFGTMNGYLMTGARIPFAMGERGQLPFSRHLASLHPRLGTPMISLFIMCFFAIIYILTGTFDLLTDLLVFVLWIFFTLGVYGIFVLRKKKSYISTYKVPFYPIVPLIGILGGVYIIYSTIATQLMNSLIGIGITLLGLPIYFYLKKKN